MIAIPGEQCKDCRKCGLTAADFRQNFRKPRKELSHAPDRIPARGARGPWRPAGHGGRSPRRRGAGPAAGPRPGPGRARAAGGRPRPGRAPRRCAAPAARRADPAARHPAPRQGRLHRAELRAARQGGEQPHPRLSGGVLPRPHLARRARPALLRPKASDKFDYEAELAIVIGKRARHLSEAEALSCVAGYTCMNEGSVRDYQRKSTQWGMGKNFDRTGGLGPEIVTPDELPQGPTRCASPPASTARRCRAATPPT
ncbi:fumarylacetoacetate hydrolase family protein [Teichococcus aestuarii]|uniref:fumarylacetoacetate hydrolase family protein n=1 Tax=Teichococcus aestuarii TaxID=568898 RepID=UPI00360C9866